MKCTHVIFSFDLLNSTLLIDGYEALVKTNTLNILCALLRRTSLQKCNTISRMILLCEKKHGNYYKWCFIIPHRSIWKAIYNFSMLGWKVPQLGQLQSKFKSEKLTYVNTLEFVPLEIPKIHRLSFSHCYVKGQFSRGCLLSLHAKKHQATCCVFP